MNFIERSASRKRVLGFFLQLLQRLVDFLLALLGGRGALLLAGLKLVLFGIELQVEQIGQVAPSSPAATACPSGVPWRTNTVWRAGPTTTSTLTRGRVVGGSAL